MYLYWLLTEKCNLAIDEVKSGRSVYQSLLNIPFQYILERDENRALDGLDLRWEYNDGNEITNLPEDCSVLEMMVALAIRITDEYISDMNDSSPRDFFLEMIDNLGLFYRDRNTIREIVEDWMNREYDWDGSGSPFPLRYPVHDQREVEIWSQAMEYLDENY